jgi:diguanylate cyclase (GGDEF)-like protein
MNKTASPFRLIRYFSIASAIGVLVVLLILLLFYRYFALNALTDHETRGNITLARVFANTIWPNHAAYVMKGASTLPRTELVRQPQVALLRKDVLQQMTGLNVAKVKIYNLAGLTVFSTDARQIGEDKSTNAGFLQARAGTTVSEITFRDRFDAMEQVINERNLVSSYVPISRSADAPVEGVLEVYSDVTDFVSALERTQWQIVAGVLGCLSLLYLFLLTIVQRADKVILAQGRQMRLTHEATLLHQENHDALTDLPNRFNFSTRVDDLIKIAKRSGTMVAVLSIDVSGLKKVNDSLGNASGDRLLKDVSRRLTESLREADITARREGAEFGAALAGIRGIEHVAVVAEKIRQAVVDPLYAIDNHKLAVATHIGISIYPDDGADAVELISSADAAMHHARQLGRNNYQFHAPAMNAKALDMLMTEQKLREALEHGEFVLHYQPKINLASGRLTGAEALIRWNDPRTGLVPPDQFIPILEETGLIHEVGRWAVRQAIGDYLRWRAAGLPVVRIAVNLSPMQLRHRGFIDEIGQAIGVDPDAADALELEITESLIMDDVKLSIASLQAIRGMGATIAIDDFGTGFSSLSYLARLPVDTLKIDRSFIVDMTSGTQGQALVSTIINLARSLKLKVVAEGVETEEQQQLLLRLGCDEMQGYLFSKAVPAGLFEAQFLARHAG